MASYEVTDEYDAVVYDLDGTLVRLAVDWAAAAEPIKPILGTMGQVGTRMRTTPSTYYPSRSRWASKPR